MLSAWQALGGVHCPQLISSKQLRSVLILTNTWDYYPYLILGCVGIGYGVLKRKDSSLTMRVFWALTGILIFIFSANLLYTPYRQWYGQGYTKIEIWGGSNTPSAEFLTHWGLFLFLISSWLFVETLDWMRNTPISALKKLLPFRGLIYICSLVILLIMMSLGLSIESDQIPLGLGVHIVWWVLPLAVWSGILLLRPGISHAKRSVLFLVGTALLLTLAVEIIVLRGDIGRMNTVFKFYLQAWTMFSVAAAAALGWLIKDLPRWNPRWRLVWQIVIIFLSATAGLYPVLAAVAKVDDRMEPSAPNTLDGMTYMKSAVYFDEGVELDLLEDYNAIRWLQNNIAGSPVIVEANQVEYHWGTRMTIYTGLPGVVGWNWHQRQQRSVIPDEWVFERVEAVHEFYQTENLDTAQKFLANYNVSYIIYGQLEQAKYSGPGLVKSSVISSRIRPSSRPTRQFLL